jgi:hypothetical protein
MKRPLLMFAVVVVLGCFASEAAACDCIVPRPTEPLSQQVNNARRASQTVFSGDVLKIDRVPPLVLVTFEVDKLWKGVFQRTLVVSTGTDDCGYTFHVGEHYLVYAVAWPNATDYSLGKEIGFTSICHRTALLSRATADLQVLGKPRSRRNAGTQQRTPKIVGREPRNGVSHEAFVNQSRWVLTE